MKLNFFKTQSWIFQMVNFKSVIDENFKKSNLISVPGRASSVKFKSVFY